MLRGRNLALVVALVSLLCVSASTHGSIILVDEDFSAGAGVVTGGNGAFAAGGGVGSLSGDGVQTFTSVGVTEIMIPELALGGQLTFQVDNLGGAANAVTRWLQVDVDNMNIFSGRNFGSTNDPALLNHGDVDGPTGTTTIPAGTTELDLLYVTTVNFGGAPLPAGEIARLGSFFAEFTPVPEPTSTAILGLGCLAFLGLRRRS